MQEMEKANAFKLQFIGGAGTVTGSKTLLSTKEKNVLIDCGLFQGLKELRNLNWEDFPVDPKSIDSIILTHAHLDHCGYIPVLVKNGFNGPIYCTPATAELTEIILLDSAKIQEEDAERAKSHHYSGHLNCKPLYTVDEAKKCFGLFNTHEYNEWVLIDHHIKFSFHNAGHILGSAMIELKVEDKVIVFTGDIGRKKPMLLYPPSKIKEADYVVLESTYGDRTHETENVKRSLKEIIDETYNRGGILMIPSFAVERTQELIYLIWQLKEENELPNIPVYLDSPMGVKSSLVFDRYPEIQNLPKFVADHMFGAVKYISGYEESKAVVADRKPKIILAGSGMLEGGRILHYLNNHGENSKNTLLFVGYQAVGTRGRDLQNGTKMVKFFGQYRPINCEIRSISSMSAHGDREEMIDWLKNFKKEPTTIFLNHGEPHQTNAFRVMIETELGWNVEIPKLNEIIEIEE
ncbi:MBL fold metallo-hydrolase [Paracrocinitomix mangrovi]|uniref:MBL fold metallo-hydrolase RNA specificity domain-containing protein n=1 Tax=Paracrocinitomix mangrovi TaxID=2862509 RepID=UPI001C8E8DEE|nr:MBL fold metallo-hydrolase [Paracrocinitomix mangrovi]UKN00708.1 MBL fold metallo-hydrolase [Paracrocinitomix mangrovi]